MPASFADLAEHTGTLVALVGTLLTICGILVTVIYKVMMRIAITLKEDILKMIQQVDGRIGEVWAEIGEIRKRQETLREQLPKEYLRIDGPGYKILSDGLARIETHLETFMDFCRTGKCKKKEVG